MKNHEHADVVKIIEFKSNKSNKSNTIASNSEMKLGLQKLYWRFITLQNACMDIKIFAQKLNHAWFNLIVQIFRYPCIMPLHQYSIEIKIDQSEIRNYSG